MTPTTNRPKTQPTVETTEVMLARLDTKMDGVSDQLSELKEKIFGNGKPGLMIEIERVNSSIKQLENIANQNAGNIKDLKAETFSVYVQKHWRTLLMIAVAFFLVIHSMLPADMSLWDWFSKFFGGG